MRITLDKEADVLAIILADAEVEETKSIAPGVEVDYDSGGRVVAIEFLNACKKYDLDETEIEPPKRFCSLAEAASLVGLSPVTLRHQIERGVLVGTKLGRNWVIQLDDLYLYLNERSRKAKHSKSRLNSHSKPASLG